MWTVSCDWFLLFVGLPFSGTHSLASAQGSEYSLKTLLLVLGSLFWGTLIIPKWTLQCLPSYQSSFYFLSLSLNSSICLFLCVLGELLSFGLYVIGLVFWSFTFVCSKSRVDFKFHCCFKTPCLFSLSTCLDSWVHLVNFSSQTSWHYFSALPP